MEEAEVEKLFADPRHPYTRALLETMPSVEGARAERLRTISGQPPSLPEKPSTCAFAARCTHAFDRCGAELPRLRDVDAGHRAACFWTPEGKA